MLERERGWIQGEEWEEGIGLRSEGVVDGRWFESAEVFTVGRVAGDQGRPGPSSARPFAGCGAAGTSIIGVGCRTLVVAEGEMGRGEERRERVREERARDAAS